MKSPFKDPLGQYLSALTGQAVLPLVAVPAQAAVLPDLLAGVPAL